MFGRANFDLLRKRVLLTRCSRAGPEGSQDRRQIQKSSEKPAGPALFGRLGGVDDGPLVRAVLLTTGSSAPRKSEATAREQPSPSTPQDHPSHGPTGPPHCARASDVG
jgi:hypothetical protein